MSNYNGYGRSIFLLVGTILGFLFGWIVKMFVSGGKEESFDYGNSADKCLLTNDTAEFKIQQNTIYMRLKSSDEWMVISKVIGDLFQGAYPPTDFDIQKVFKNYGLEYEGNFLTYSKEAFHNHSGFASSGDGQTFDLSVKSSFPEVFRGNFKITNGYYETDLNSSGFYSLGRVLTNPDGTVKPIEGTFAGGYTLAPGSLETINNNQLFALHGKYTSSPEPGDGKIFQIDIMKNN